MRRTIWIVMILIFMAIFVPMNANVNAGEHPIIELGKDFTFSGSGTKVSGYLMVNTSDNVTINWKNGNAAAADRFDVCIFSNAPALNWSNNLVEVAQAGASYCGGLAIYGWKWDYSHAIIGPTSESAPGTYWFRPSMTGFIYIDIEGGGGTVVQTINVTLVKDDFFIDRSELDALSKRLDDLNNTLTGMNDTLTSLNNTISGLDLQSIADTVASLQDQIDNLTHHVNNNTINITALQTAVSSLQNQLNNLKTEVASINATVTASIGTSHTTNLTAINQSVADLSKALDSLNQTVQNIKVPPDMQSNMTKLQTENAQLKTNLSALQKQVDGINKTTYVNNTITKRIKEGLEPISMIIFVVIAVVIGGVVGAVCAIVITKRELRIEADKEINELRKEIAQGKKEDIKLDEAEALLKR